MAFTQSIAPAPAPAAVVPAGWAPPSRLLSALRRFEHIERPGLHALVSVLEGIDVSHEDFAAIARWDTAKYVRTPLLRTDAFECLLLTWLPGQRTAIHDHGDAIGAVRVLSGSVCERTFVVLDGIAQVERRVTHVAGSVFGAAKGVVHDLGVPLDREQAGMSLHVYAPDLAGLRTYRSTGDA
jgi:hypothetical protein